MFFKNPNKQNMNIKVFILLLFFAPAHHLTADGTASSREHLIIVI